VNDTPTHRRTITIESFDVEGGYEVTAELRDERPWADESSEVRSLHTLALTLHVDRETLTVTDARAQMKDFPHAECQSIEPAFRSLVGVSVARGYNKAVQERLGRERGCSHLEFLARAMGPAIIQTMASSNARSGRRTVSGPEAIEPGGWLRNTCHLWSEGGIGYEKLLMGWRPGDTEYPTPALVELRRRQS
jgi:hypothetical protein